MDVVVDSVPITTLIRWYMYDLEIKDTNKLAEAFSMMPVSEEGDEKEAQDARARMSKVMPLIPFLEVCSGINAKAIITLQEEELIKMGMTLEQIENEKEFLNLFYQNVSFAALVSTLSTAIELGLLVVNGTLTDVGAPDEF